MSSCSLVKILKPGVNGRIRSDVGTQTKNIYDCDPVWFPGGTLMLEVGRAPPPFAAKWREMMFEGKVYLVPRWGFSEVELPTTGEDDDFSERDS